MDWSKYPLDKLAYFAGEVIPGFVALLIFERAAHGSFGWFFTLGFLGYRTKLSLVLLVAFVVGHTLNSVVRALLGAAGGAFAGAAGYLPPYSHDVAPWRDPSWRKALKKQLGEQAPNDSRLMTSGMLDVERRMVERLPIEQRLARESSLLLQKHGTEKDDTNWAEWYNHYHKLVIQPDDRDVLSHVRMGLNDSLETTALYVLLSAVFVHDLRHWWCIGPASIWTLSIFGSTYWAWKQLTDKWSTLHAQVRYLSTSHLVQDKSARGDH
jgi:hypothetical protein